MLNRLRASPVIFALAVAALLAGVAAVPLSVNAQGAVNAHKAAQKKAEQRKFGFTVVDVEVETCCTDSPSKPTPDGRVYITGHDPGGWRASLSCFPAVAYFEKFPPQFSTDGNLPERLTDKQKEYWSDVAVAAFEPESHGQSKMRLYTFGEKLGPWKEIGDCFINGSIDNATNTFGVYVASSTYLRQKREYVLGVTTTGLTADGKKMENMETLTLGCTEGVQRPCVSVSPQVLWAVRNGSWIRLCDGDFKLIGTYRITAELP